MLDVNLLARDEVRRATAAEATAPVDLLPPAPPLALFLTRLGRLREALPSASSSDDESSMSSSPALE
jgi:hypothetical protein